MYREQIDAGSSSENAAAPRSDKALIVIPCLNEREHIAQLLARVQEDTAELDSLVVVADGGSTDGTADILAEVTARDPNIKIVFNPKQVQSAGVNLAVRAFGEGRQWLVRLDAHAQYPAGYIKTLIAEAHHTDAASVVVAMTSRGTGYFQSAVAAVQNSVLGAGGAAHRRPGKAQFVDHGHHALFDLRRFREVGGYDESASHNEDAEFDIRLSRAGGKIWLTRAVDVVYFPRNTIQSLYSQYFCYGRGRAATLVRHRKAPKLRQVLPAGVGPSIVAISLAPWHMIAAAPALLWAVSCIVFGTGVALRAGIQAAFFAGIAAMTIHTAWSLGFWWELLSRAWRGNGAAFNAVPSANDAAS